MEIKIPDNLITLKSHEDRRLLFEQYKLMTESLNKINEIRETANTFWTSLNGALIGAIAYLRDAAGLAGNQKSSFILTIIFLGVVFSSSWLSYLVTIKKSVDMRNHILIALEKYLPAKVFTLCIIQQEKKKKTQGLSLLKKCLSPPYFYCVIYYFLFYSI